MRARPAISARLAVALTLAASVAATFLPSTTATAQQPYPNKLVRLVVTVSAGSVADGLARIVAEKLSELWRQQVIVENRLGIAGIVSGANAAPDGYTLMVNAANTPVVTKLLNRDAPFDPLKDFVGVTKLASAPLVAVVSPSVAATTLEEFIALARSNPGRFNFSSSGVGSINHLCFELIKRGAKIDVVHVPYKGAPEAMTSILRDDAQITLTPISQARPMVQAGKVRAIAVNDSVRSPELPDTKTVAETLPGFRCDLWFAIVAPAGSPIEIVEKVSRDVASILADKDVFARFKVYGAVPAASSPEALDKQIRQEASAYAEILAQATRPVK